MRTSFAVLLALTVASANAACPSAKLLGCTQTFIDYLNYPIQDTGSVWKDYATFMNFTDALFTQNVGDPTGLVTICNSLEQLRGCLYGYDCFSPFAFLDRKATPEQAFIFAGLFQEYSFRCGAGLYTILRENFPCVQRVVGGHNAQLNGCLNVFIANIQHDMQGACTHVNTYVNCVGSIFNRSECGYAGSSDHWWACEGAYQLTQPGFPNCKVSCARGGPPNFAQFVAEHTKIENGEFWLKLPDVFKQVNGKWQLTENIWVRG